MGLKVNKSKYSREILLEIGKNHLEHFKTAKHWDQYAQKNNLPKSWAFHTYFGTWQQAKRTLGLHGAGVKLTPLEVLKIAKENKEHFQSADRWNTYAEKHNLPKHSVFLKYFRTWNNAKELVHGYRIRTSTTGYTSASLLKIALEHKENFTTASNWEKYSKACKLPSATTYRNFFGTWNDAKNKLGLLAIKNSYTTQELIEIAKENKEHFSSMSNWNSHAKKKALPTGETYIKRFGSWKKSHKECLGTYNCTKIKYNYPKEMLLKIAKAHIENFTSVRSWSKYAKEHELPSIKPYVNQFGSWNEAKKAVGVDEIRYRKNYTTDELKQIAQKHKKYFTSISIWDKYARKHNLPWTVTYSNRFGSWNKAKKAVGASSS
ncbi:hypothetical protein ACH0BF_24020 [Pseudobacillus sp. 179-B 2D1 NHS]|uniref:hypothetical protein n=1 Tax=Pseudobacillus sp. 179-B 2D1 NHS TaxID=3374292 RepID=UPI003879CB8E